MPTFLLLFLTFLSSIAAAEQKPNILFIFADDMTHEAVGALGHPEVKTPNIDRIFQSGTTFTHAYNPGAWNGAVCIASRTMLMTGRRLWYAHREKANLDEMTLWPQHLQKAGYQTYFTGKWHLKTNARRAFQNVGHVRPGMPGDKPHGYNRPLADRPDPWDPADPQNGGFWAGGKHWSEVEADTAVRFLKKATKTPDPFFFYLAFNAPHDPRQAPQEYLDQYPAKHLTLPANFLPANPHRNIMRSPHIVRDEFLAPLPRTPEAVKTHRAEYFALITHLDAQIGRVLDALESSGQADNTIVIFSADHGLAMGSHGLLGKQNPYDHSIRVPLAISGPGFSTGEKVTHGVYLQDLVPTTLQLAGAPLPENVQFHDVRTANPNRGPIYFGYRDSQRALVHKNHKLIHYPRGPVTLLFDLQNDPHETKNLAPKKPALTKTLLTLLRQTAKAHGDQLEF